MKVAHKNTDIFHLNKIQLKGHDHDHDHDVEKNPSWDHPVSLATATPSCDQKRKIKYIWRPNPYAFRTLALRTLQNRRRNISGRSKFLNLFIVLVQREDETAVNESVTPFLCGVTLGIGLIFGFTYNTRKNLSTIGHQHETDYIGDVNPALQKTCAGHNFKDARIEKETERSMGTTPESRTRNESSTKLINGSQGDNDSFQNDYSSDNNTIEKVDERRLITIEAATSININSRDRNTKKIDNSQRSDYKLEKIETKEIDISVTQPHGADLKEEDSTSNAHHAAEPFKHSDNIAHLDEKHWTEIDASRFNIRSRKYMSDKIKTPSKPNLLRLITVDFVEASKPIMTGFCSHPKERVQKWLADERILGDQDKIFHARQLGTHIMPEFVFCINVTLPGPPNYHFLMYWAVDDFASLGILGEGSKNDIKPHSKLLDDFFFGSSDKFRNKVLKLIPHIIKGNAFLKAAVGSNPMLLGKRLKPTYVRTDRFLEVIIDVSSNAMTERLVKLATSCKGEIVAEFGFVLEGDDETVLPENILGSICIQSSEFDGKPRCVDSA